MDTNPAKTVRRNSIAVALFLIIGIMALVGLVVAFVPSYLLNTILAIAAIATAIILPIHQKRISLVSFLLVVSGILFLLSGVVDNTYHAVVDPLPVLQQIEFSKTMRPLQVSRGLSHLGMGILYVLFSLFRFQTKGISAKPKSKQLKVLQWVVAIAGVWYAALGVLSIFEGLSKL